jgi:uncharacterized protein YukE
MLRRGLSLAVLVVLVAALVLMLARPYALIDWAKLRNYTAPADIAALAEATTMTDKARHLFYINHPALDDKPTFRQKCPDYGEQTIVIGCYQGGQRGIHILDVTDERLAGVEEVTAAHEMLHAAYDRLGRDERQRIDGLLQDYAVSQLRDERIIAALEGYKVSEPGQGHNEMHSMFGTEIAELPAELETYYAQYFSSRQTVVGFAQKYQAAFASRQAAIKDYDEQLRTRSDQIKANMQALEGRGAEIEAMRRQLERDRTAGDIDAYNAGVGPFNARVEAYNSLLEETRTMISQYNAMVEERNAIAAQTVELQEAIDSSSLPAEQ